MRAAPSHAITGPHTSFPATQLADTHKGHSQKVSSKSTFEIVCLIVPDWSNHSTSALPNEKRGLRVMAISSASNTTRTTPPTRACVTHHRNRVLHRSWGCTSSKKSVPLVYDYRTILLTFESLCLPSASLPPTSAHRARCPSENASATSDRSQGAVGRCQCLPPVHASSLLTC